VRQEQPVDPAQSLSARFADFRRTHPARHLQIAGIDWTYLTAGKGRDCIVLLHGAGGTGEMYFDYLLDFEADHLALAPSLPPEIDTTPAALQGIVAILDAQGIATCHVFGHSQGGFLAQEFAPHYPDRVRTLMLSGTALPRASHLRKLERQSRFLRFIPDSLLAKSIRYALRRAIRSSAQSLSTEQRRFLLDDLVVLPPGTALRRALHSTAALQMEFHRQILGEEVWRGPVLLFETDRDAFISQQEFATLRRRYPQAEIQRFENADHLSVVADPPRYINAIRRFLSKHEMESASPAAAHR